MITKVLAKNFKNLSFQQDLEAKNLIIGPNGAGKSARAEALTLAVMGYVPGSGKQNAEILANFGTSDQLMVGFQIDDARFERFFNRSKTGKVSQNYYINRTKATKEDFIGMLAKKGKPKILDLGAFLSQSDQKKVDTLFSMFPPGEDMVQLESDIGYRKEQINRLHKSIKRNEELITQLSRNKGLIELPAGTLAEVQAELKKTDDELEEAQKELKEAEIKNAEEEAKAQAEAELKKISEDADRQAAEQEAMLHEQLAKDEEHENFAYGSLVVPVDESSTFQVPPDSFVIDVNEVIESIDKIIKALEMFSENTAMKVAQRELSKYEYLAKGGQ